MKRDKKEEQRERNRTGLKNQKEKREKLKKGNAIIARTEQGQSYQKNQGGREEKSEGKTRKEEKKVG